MKLNNNTSVFATSITSSSVSPCIYSFLLKTAIIYSESLTLVGVVFLVELYKSTDTMHINVIAMATLSIERLLQPNGDH